MNGGAKDEHGLTLKQRKFCQAYIGEANGNGTEAARIAGYDGDDPSLGQIAYENLRKLEVTSAIAAMRQVAEIKAEVKILSATETLAGITDIANSDIADLFPDNEFLQEAKLNGVSKRIKTINFDKDTGAIVRVEMYSAQAGLQDMAKFHKLLADRVVITSEETDNLSESAASKLGRPVPGRVEDETERLAS